MKICQSEWMQHKMQNWWVHDTNNSARSLQLHSDWLGKWMTMTDEAAHFLNSRDKINHVEACKLGV